MNQQFGYYGLNVQLQLFHFFVKIKIRLETVLEISASTSDYYFTQQQPKLSFIHFTLLPLWMNCVMMHMRKYKHQQFFVLIGDCHQSHYKNIYKYTAHIIITCRKQAQTGDDGRNPNGRTCLVLNSDSDKDKNLNWDYLLR